ncbi:MAG: methyltransferase domain-containing protein [Chlamydiales bacterium]
MFKIYTIVIFSLIANISAICNAAESKIWENYYQNTLNISDPHKTLLLAQKYFQLENKIGGMAADLGAGTGRDTLFLLQQGWDVLALDAEQLSIDIILNRVDVSYLKSLEVMAIPFSEMILPAELDLINASYSLPFCKPQDFSQCWRNIIDHLAIGGRFSGQFFGEKDEWATNADLTIHSYEKMLQLFEDQFVIEYLQIEDGLIPCANGKMKHWHVYHLVAKKIR